MDRLYKKFWSFFDGIFGFESALAKLSNRDTQLSDSILIIFAFLLLLLVFSIN